MASFSVTHNAFIFQKNLIANLVLLGDFKQNSEFSAFPHKSESCRAKLAIFHGNLSGGGVAAVPLQGSRVCPFTHWSASGSGDLAWPHGL